MKRTTKFRDCGENIYTGANAVKMFNSGIATDTWYNGMSQYDFATYKPKDPLNTVASDQFTQLVWKNILTVSFGIRDKTVVAWYCKPQNTGGNTPRTKSAFMQNVQKVCVMGAGSGKWNMCYNER